MAKLPTLRKYRELYCTPREPDDIRNGVLPTYYESEWMNSPSTRISNALIGHNFYRSFPASLGPRLMPNILVKRCVHMHFDNFSISYLTIPAHRRYREGWALESVGVWTSLITFRESVNGYAISQRTYYSPLRTATIVSISAFKTHVEVEREVTPWEISR